MRLIVGDTYQVINADVPQGTPGNPPLLTVSTITEHEGAFIVSGHISTFQTHPYMHGFLTIPEKSAVFVCLPIEYEVIVIELVKLLKGLPLALQGQLGIGKPQRIVNWAERLGSLWYTLPGQHATIQEKQRRAKKVVDLYHEIRRTQTVPQWFLSGRNVQVPVGAA